MNFHDLKNMSDNELRLLDDEDLNAVEDVHWRWTITGTLEDHQMVQPTLEELQEGSKSIEDIINQEMINNLLKKENYNN